MRENDSLIRMKFRAHFGLIASAVCLLSAGLVVSAASAQKSARKPTDPRGVGAFRAKVEKILSAPDVIRGYWGLLVEDGDSGEVLYSSNADKYFVPASNAKLFTAALILATLGTDRTFRTTIETKATLDSDGVLHGDLALIGRGDPNLSNRIFPFTIKTERDGPPEKILVEMADAGVARGVKKIEGDVIGDDSYFEGGAYPSGWSIDDMLWNYGAPVSALEINDGTLFIDLAPGSDAGSPATCVVTPWAAMYQVRNLVTTSAKGVPQKLTVMREPGSRVITISGTIPIGAASRSLGVAIEWPAEYAAALLKNLLEARGVTITGTARARHTGDPDATYAEVRPVAALGASSQAPAAGNAPNSTVLAEHVSPSLSDALRVMVKTSQNLHAEMMFRDAAVEATGDATEDGALQFEQTFRASAGIQENDVVMTDGSGLSRRDLVSPESEVMILRWAATQPWGEQLRSALPVAGVDGTLMDRMLKTPAAGNVQAKSGSLTHVNSLAGYATTVRGEHLVFSFIGNNHDLKDTQVTNVLDALTVAMVQELGTRQPPTRK